MLAGTLEFDSDAQQPAHVIKLTRTTLLLTDLVGSSALLRKCGDQAGGEILHRLMNRQVALVRHLDGSPVQLLGDGLLSRFVSPAAAVQAAELIVSAHRHDLFGCSSHPVSVRVAVHQGSMGVLPDGDVIGREATLVFEMIHHTRPNRAILSGPVARACSSFIAAEALPAFHLEKSGLTVEPWLLDAVREQPSRQLDRIAGYLRRMHPGQALPHWATPSQPA